MLTRRSPHPAGLFVLRVGYKRVPWTLPTHVKASQMNIAKPVHITHMWNWARAKRVVQARADSSQQKNAWRWNFMRARSHIQAYISHVTWHNVTVHIENVFAGASSRMLSWRWRNWLTPTNQTIGIGSCGWSRIPSDYLRRTVRDQDNPFHYAYKLW